MSWRVMIATLRVAGVIVYASIAVGAAAIPLATPACDSTGPCVSYYPDPPNTAVQTQVQYLLYSGIPTDAQFLAPNFEVTGSTVKATVTYVAGLVQTKPPPRLLTVSLPPLPSADYNLVLTVAPDASYAEQPPPVITADGTSIVGGILISSDLKVVSATSGATEAVVEYYYPPFDHYFMTGNPDEIALLDAKEPPFQDWQRTGEAFKAYVNASAPASTVPVCRFFNDHFAGKSSHFYAGQGSGCEETFQFFTDWTLETATAFNVVSPAADGSCMTGTAPLYRVYNNGMGGAPGHRYMTSLTIRQDMIGAGWIPEGTGIGVVMCVPE